MEKLTLDELKVLESIKNTGTTSRKRTHKIDKF